MIGRFKGLVNGEPVYETLAGPTDGQVEKAAYCTGKYAVTITPDESGDGYVGISCACKITYTPYCDVCGDGSCYMGVLETDCFIGKANDADHACTADDACHAKDGKVCPLPDGKVYPTGVSTAETTEANRTQYHSDSGYYCTCDGVYYGTVTNSKTVTRTATTANATCRLALFDNNTSVDCASLSVSNAGYNPSTSTLSATCMCTTKVISPLVSSSSDLCFTAGTNTTKLCCNGYYYGNICGNLCGTALTSCYVRKVQACDNSYRHLLLTADNNANDCTTVCVSSAYKFIANPYNGTMQIQNSSGARSGSFYSNLVYADNMRTANIYSYTNSGTLNIGGTNSSGTMVTSITAGCDGIARTVGVYDGTTCTGNYKIPFASLTGTGTSGSPTSLTALHYEASNTFTYNPSIGRLLVGCISTDAILVDSVQPKTHNRCLNLNATDANGCAVEGIKVSTTGAALMKGTYTSGNAAYKIPFSTLTGTGTAGCSTVLTGLAYDTENTFTYNPSSNLLTVPYVTSTSVCAANIYTPQTSGVATTTAFYGHTASNTNVMVACVSNNGLFYHRYWLPTNNGKYNMTFASSTGTSSGTCSALGADSIDWTGAFNYVPSTHTLNVCNVCVSGTLAVSSLHAATADCACCARHVENDADVYITSSDCVFICACNFVCIDTRYYDCKTTSLGVGGRSIVVGNIGGCVDYSDFADYCATILGSDIDVCDCYDNYYQSTLVGYGHILHNNSDCYSIGGNTFVGYKNCLIDAPNDRCYNTAVGYMNTIQDCYSTAIGYKSYSSDCGVSIGCYATSNIGGVSIGRTSCSGTCAVSIGYVSCACGMCAVAIGNQARALANYAVAIGNYSCATCAMNTAVGHCARALSITSTALGGYSCTNSCGTAVGYSAIANSNGTAVGMCARASGVCSVALGYCACTNGTDAVAIGCTACAGYACCGIYIHEHVQFGPHHGRITVTSCGCLKHCDWYWFGRHFFTNIANKGYCASTGDNVIYRASVHGRTFNTSATSAGAGTGACTTGVISNLMYFGADGTTCSPNNYFAVASNPVNYPFWNFSAVCTDTATMSVAMVAEIIW